MAHPDRLTLTSLHLSLSPSPRTFQLQSRRDLVECCDMGKHQAPGA
jgi:hypothetical protein